MEEFGSFSNFFACGLILTLAACSSQRNPASSPTTISQAAAPATPDAFRSISDSKFRAYKHGIFEIVVPWDLKSQVSYEEDLPYEKLPYHMRKDPYFSVGTGFAISPSIIVSAAHVFDAHKLSYFTQQIKLRGTDGKIYEIDKVIRYSQHRDLIGFTLKKYPKNLRPLKASIQTTIGQVVFAVGNALGQGVVVRDGRVASFTPEEVNGEWNFIRFTAPASPGNSGGALLNDQGKVVGIVVRRSENENLNYAVPIEEFVKLPGKYASFYDSSWGEFEAGKSLRSPWQAKVKLPMKLNAFQTKAHQSFVASFKSRRNEFEIKFKNEIYPNNKKFKSWLSEQSMNFNFAEVKPDTNGNWNAYIADTQESRIGPDQKVYVGARKKEDHIEFYIERPKDMKLEKFFNSPNLVSKAFLDTIDFKRDFASHSIKIKSLGKAKSSHWWRDELGRSWRTTKWPLEYMDASLMSHCLPTPKGMACKMTFTPLWEEPIEEFYSKINAKRSSLSYNGKYKDWQEFVQLPKKYLPSILQSNIKISLNKNKLSYRFHDIKGQVIDKNLSRESELSVGAIYDLKNPSKLSLFKVLTKPEGHKASAYASEYVFQPSKLSAKEMKNRWSDLSKIKAPYDGITRNYSEGYQTFFIAGSGSGRIPASSSDRKLVYSCYHDNSISQTQSKKLCDEFKNSSIRTP
ncbi:trypsin-like peptidase domain-containing protein [bacterium]|nr:trypsin-like peptidase domain-containing protein [bacterium]